MTTTTTITNKSWVMWDLLRKWTSIVHTHAKTRRSRCFKRKEHIIFNNLFFWSLMIGIKNNRTQREIKQTSKSYRVCRVVWRGGCSSAWNSSSSDGRSNSTPKIHIKKIILQINRAHRTNCNGIKGLGRGNSANCVRRHRDYNVPSKFFLRFHFSPLKIKRSLINPLFNFICIESFWVRVVLFIIS